MTRLELLTLVVGRARLNGFEFRRWYTNRLGITWINAEAALRLLDSQRRYYALLFSHEFASAFWKTGSEITLELPAQSFERRMPDGSLRTITRNSYVRRTLRRDVWRYHLRQMALAEEPLRYLRRFLRIEEQLEPDPGLQPIPPEEPAPPTTKRTTTRAKKALVPKKRASPRPLPPGPPSFLKRPYPGSTS